MSATIGAVALAVILGLGIRAGRRNALAARQLHRRNVDALNARLCSGKSWTIADVESLRGGFSRPNQEAPPALGPCKCVCDTCAAGEHCDTASCATIADDEPLPYRPAQFPRTERFLGPYEAASVVALKSAELALKTSAASSAADRPAGVSADQHPAPPVGHLTSAGPPAAVDDPAGIFPPVPAGSPPLDETPPDHATSDLLIAAANQLAQYRLVAPKSTAWTARTDYLAELIPELRDRAAQFAAHGD